ncbi:Monoglyceride lipase [Tetrabaena socialis]|uniref:Monoglyceride lipase n=1 Tax=Tetrabaena socialis TaxID=47790 RepID=A0A2J8A2N9_9CHLO|nr:Monoglyceride lipase [Tetrabaena socialis]|eukprot:PNH06789.1 Monoglyceride lipase [Tetrabaena socialis]
MPLSQRGVAVPAAVGAALAVALLARSAARSAATDASRIAEHKHGMDARRAQHQDAAGSTTTAVISNAQGLELYLRQWVPTQGLRVCGVVVMVHGFTVHSGLFSGVAQHLAEQGLAVVSYDQQGHGLSDCFEGLRGYIRGFADLVEDAVQVLGWARSQHPGVPAFLLGESLGGTVVLSALRRESVREEVRGAVLMAPGIRVSKAVLPPWPLMPFLRAAAAIFPR